MGEESFKPNHNNLAPENGNNSDVEMQSHSDTDSEEYEDMSPEEFAVIDSQLDALNSALDEIEQKNDSIHAQLLLLLEENREIRRQIKESTDNNDESEASPSPPV